MSKQSKIIFSFYRIFLNHLPAVPARVNRLLYNFFLTKFWICDCCYLVRFIIFITFNHNYKQTENFTRSACVFSITKFNFHSFLFFWENYVELKYVKIYTVQNFINWSYFRQNMIPINKKYTIIICELGHPVSNIIEYYIFDNIFFSMKNRVLPFFIFRGPLRVSENDVTTIWV